MRLLAVRQDNNGDVTLLGPALRALAARGTVTLVCGPGGEGAARLLPGVAEVVVIRAEWIEGRPQPVSPERIAADIAHYARIAPDEAFIFTSFHQSPLPTALLLRLAGVAQIAAIGVDYPGSLLDTRVRADDGIDDVHEVERALRLVAARGFALPAADDGRLAYVPLPARDPQLPGRYVAVQPGATVEARAWSPAKLRALVARLRLPLAIPGEDVLRIDGAFGAAAAAELVRAGERRAVVVRDATHVTFGGKAFLELAARLDLRCERVLRPIACTVAPFAWARAFEPRAFARAVAQRTGLPTFDAYAGTVAEPHAA